MTRVYQVKVPALVKQNLPCRTCRAAPARAAPVVQHLSCSTRRAARAVQHRREPGLQAETEGAIY
jgi:hypothetical protein